MNIHKNLKNARRLIWAGAILGYSAAVTVAILNLRESRDTLLTAIAFLLVLSLPPTIALISLDRRPSLLPAATMAVVLQGILLFTTPVAWLLFVVMALWIFANRRRPGASTTPRHVAWWRPLIGAATLFPLMIMFVHMDPACTITGTDDQIIEVQPNPSAQEGWVLPPRMTSIETGATGEGTVKTCTSDSIRAWEAGLSMILSGAIAAAAFKWPTNNQLNQASPHEPAARIGPPRDV